MIQYTIYKNRLSTSEVVPYLAKTLLDGSLSFELLIKALAYGSTATTADVKAVLDNLERVCIENLSQGRSVNLGFCILRPQVKGKFSSPIDSFSAENNWIEVSMSPCSAFEKKVTIEAKLEKVAQSKPSPLPLSVENHTSGLGTLFSATDVITIQGENLRFAKSDLNQGVFFDKDVSQVRVAEYIKVTAKEIVFKVPTGLVAGESYKLKLKCVFGQELRTGEFENEIKTA